MRNVVVLLCALVIAAISFYAGSRIGQRQYTLADSQYSASLAAVNLKLLDADPETLRKVFQVQLSTALANHGRYLKSSWKWLWPDFIAQDDHAIRRAVKYRLEHPYAEIEPAFNEKVDPEFRNQVSADFAENQRYVEAVVNAYR